VFISYACTYFHLIKFVTFFFLFLIFIAARFSWMVNKDFQERFSFLAVKQRSSMTKHIART